MPLSPKGDSPLARILWDESTQQVNWNSMCQLICRPVKYGFSLKS